MLDSPIVQMFVRTQLPNIKNYLKQGEEAYKKYLDKILLQDGETHVAAFTEVFGENVFIVIGAFSGKTFVRTIEARPFVDWLSNLLTKNIGNEERNGES